MSKEIRELLDKFRLTESKIISEIKEINESNLSRVWQHIQNRTPFAFLSLSRGGMTKNEKENAYTKLKKIIRAMGYGYIQTKGGYVEKGFDGEPDTDVVDELSIMVPNITKEDALTVGQIDLGHGSQDSILYCDGKDFLGYLNTNEKEGPIGSVLTKFEYGKDHEALPMGKEAVKQYFSFLSKGSHSDRKFSFKPKMDESFVLYEMKDIKYPKYPEKDWWYNFGFRIF